MLSSLYVLPPTLIAAFNANAAQFTAVLDHLLGDAYRVANPPGTPSRRGNNSWFTIQKLAFEHGKRNNKEIQNLVLEAHRLSVKLPIVRKAVKSTRIEVEGCDDIFIQEGQTIVCDTVCSTLLSPLFELTRPLVPRHAP